MLGISFVYTHNIGSWDENYDGPALTGIDIDEENNNLYFTFNCSIFMLPLSQSNPSAMLVASYNNLVFNPRISSRRNELFFCLRSNTKEQGTNTTAYLSLYIYLEQYD
jgi:hypothetical protein